MGSRLQGDEGGVDGRLISKLEATKRAVFAIIGQLGPKSSYEAFPLSLLAVIK
jgi:hypothetical protein